jgi:hypothetical protein
VSQDPNQASKVPVAVLVAIVVALGGCGSSASTTTATKLARPSYVKFEEAFRHSYVEGVNRDRLRNVQFGHESYNGSIYGHGYVVEGWGVIKLNGNCFSERAFITTGGEIVESKPVEAPPNAEANPCVHGMGH